MGFVMASSIMGALRDSVEVLLSGGSESLWLVLWDPDSWLREPLYDRRSRQRDDSTSMKARRT